MAECLAAEAPASAEDYVEAAIRIFEEVGARNDLARATGAALRQGARDQSMFADDAPMLPVKGILAARNGDRDVVMPSLNHVLWSGCRDNKLSGEGNIGGEVRGFFTYAFCKCLRGAGLNVTRAKLGFAGQPVLAPIEHEPAPTDRGHQSLAA